jgi:RNA polymerase sigma factor (sigma-70 family)
MYLELPKILHSFKKEKGGNFLTYAGKCFKTKLYRYIGSNGNLIHIPEDLGKKIRKIRKDENMGLTRVKLEKRVQQGISALRMNSLEEGFRLNGEESDSSFSYEQTLTYPIKDNLEKQANFSLLRDYLKQTFKEMYDSGILDENKYSVMLMRYVLDGKDYRVTLNEIGKQKQVSRQRVFQIEQAAIKIIKKYPGVMKELERYFSLLKKLD